MCSFWCIHIKTYFIFRCADIMLSHQQSVKSSKIIFVSLVESVHADFICSLYDGGQPDFRQFTCVYLIPLYNPETTLWTVFFIKDEWMKIELTQQIVLQLALHILCRIICVYVFCCHSRAETKNWVTWEWIWKAELRTKLTMIAYVNESPRHGTESPPVTASTALVVCYRMLAAAPCSLWMAAQ